MDKMLQWTFRLGKNVTVDVVNLDVTSRQRVWGFSSIGILLHPGIPGLWPGTTTRFPTPDGRTWTSPWWGCTGTPTCPEWQWRGPPGLMALSSGSRLMTSRMEADASCCCSVDPQRDGGVEAVLKGLDDGAVVDGPGVCSHLLQTQPPENTSLHCVIELAVEFLQPPGLNQPPPIPSPIIAIMELNW